MLGIRGSHEPLKGESAKRFLEKLVRIQTGNLNDEDKRDMEAIKEREQTLPKLGWPNTMLSL